jgi:hypothetical protein
VTQVVAMEAVGEHLLALIVEKGNEAGQILDLDHIRDIVPLTAGVEVTAEAGAPVLTGTSRLSALLSKF